MIFVDLFPEEEISSDPWVHLFLILKHNFWLLPTGIVSIEAVKHQFIFSVVLFSLSFLLSFDLIEWFNLLLRTSCQLSSFGEMPLLCLLIGSEFFSWIYYWIDLFYRNLQILAMMFFFGEVTATFKNFCEFGGANYLVIS